jgi:hypothetical protein
MLISRKEMTHKNWASFQKGFSKAWDGYRKTKRDSTNWGSRDHFLFLSISCLHSAFVKANQKPEGKTTYGYSLPSPCEEKWEECISRNKWKYSAHYAMLILLRRTSNHFFKYSSFFTYFLSKRLYFPCVYYFICDVFLYEKNKCSVSLIIREMQIRPQWDIPHTPVKMSINKTMNDHICW